jgi:colanic acid/amylovoran biosynthesis protein
MLIEIRGVQFVNKGALLMLEACLAQLRQKYPAVQIALAPNQNSPFLARAAVGALQKVSLRFRGFDINALSYWLPLRLRRFLRHWFGFVFEADLDLVLDASGFAYGDQWGGRNVKLLAAEITRLKRHKAGYVLLPQAFGPFSRQSDQQALAKGLPAALMVCARDEHSFQYLVQHAPVADIGQFADFTNLLQPDVHAATSMPTEKPYGLVIPNSAMLGPRNNNNAWRTVYLQQLQTAIQLMRERGIRPMLLNHEGKADEKLCKQLLEIDAGLELISPDSALEVKAWIAGAQLVTCSRFHGCVSALSSGVPCIGTSWSHKYEMLFAEYEQQALIQPDTSEDELRLLMEQVCSAENRQLLQQRAEYWKQQSRLMWQTVFQRIDSAVDSGQVQIKQA